MLLDPMKDNNGNYVDSAGNQATPLFVSLLRNTFHDYTVLYGSSNDYSFATSSYISEYSIVCKKAPKVNGKRKM